jgi:hypothetical protein
MATTITKLFPTGILQSAVELDEVTYTSIKVSPTGVYAAEFDEVSINPVSNGVAKKEYPNGNLQVAGYFDEYTISNL